MKLLKLALVFLLFAFCNAENDDAKVTLMNLHVSIDFDSQVAIDYYKKAEDSIHNFYQGGQDKLSELAQTVKEKGEHVYKTTENLALEVAKKTKEALYYYLEVLQHSSVFCYNCAKLSAATVYQTVEKTSSEVCKIVQQETANFVEKVKDGYNSLQEKCADIDARKSTQKAAANFVNGVNDLGSATEKQGSKFVDEVTEKSTGAFESAKEVCKPYYKKFMAEVSKYYEMVSGFPEVVREKFTQMGNIY